MSNALASALLTKDHLTVYGRLFASRMSALPIQNVLVYQMATVPASALDILAEQFHVTGFEAWAYCDTVDKKRELLRTSILLHAKKGTPWSIKKVCEIAGYPGVYFQEGISHYYNGVLNYDGSDTHGSHGWARFKAFIPVADPGSVPDETITLLTNIINEYKPARDYMDALVFVSI